MSEVNLEELRENARTNYGITNAADLEADQLQSEMDAIDKQAADAEKERKATEKADQNTAQSDAEVQAGDATGEAVQKANVALKAADDEAPKQKSGSKSSSKKS